MTYKMKYLKSNFFRFIFRFFVSAILLFFIFRFIEIDKVYKELINVNIFYIILSVLFLIFPLYFKVARWKNIIQIFKIHIGMTSVLSYTLISFAYAFITPGRVGEFVKVKFLADKTGIGYLKSFTTVVTEKIFDVLIMALLVFLGFSFLREILPWSNYFIYLFIFYLLILVLVFVYFDRVMLLVSSLFPKKYKESIRSFPITRLVYAKLMLFSLFFWIALSVQAVFILKALGGSIPLLLMMGFVPLMAFSSMLPISIGGFGVREAVAIYLLSIAGIPIEKSAVFSLIYALITLGIPAIMGAILNIKKEK